MPKKKAKKRISKQRLSQLLKRARGECAACSEPATEGEYCAFHRQQRREISKAYYWRHKKP